MTRLDDIPGAESWDQESRRKLVASGQVVQLSAGSRAFACGEPCAMFPWVLAGRIRVQLVTESGREILLYRVAPGECCVVTVSTMLRHEIYAAEAICETDVTALALPAATFHDLLGRSAAFREMVLGDYARRVGDILTMVDATVSRPLPGRLAALVAERTRDDATLAATHHDLAVELGTAREVVSRTLKEWERRGVVSLARGRIDVEDRSALLRMRDM